MGMMSTKKRPGAPARENQRAENERTPETHRTQPISENSLDVAQMTAQAYCVEEVIQQPAQDRDEALILVPSEGMGPQEVFQEGSEPQAHAEASGSPDVTHGSVEEDNIAPELANRTEEVMVETEAPCSRTDYLCERCQECMLGESFGDSSESSTSALEYGLYSSLMSEPWISPELSQLLLPPVEMLDSWDTIKEAQCWKEFEFEAHPDGPTAEATGAQAASLLTQQPSESAHISDGAPPMVPADKEAKAAAETPEEAAAEIPAC